MRLLSPCTTTFKAARATPLLPRAHDQRGARPAGGGLGEGVAGVRRRLHRIRHGPRCWRRPSPGRSSGSPGRVSAAARCSCSPGSRCRLRSPCCSPTCPFPSSRPLPDASRHSPDRPRARGGREVGPPLAPGPGGRGGGGGRRAPAAGLPALRLDADVLADPAKADYPSRDEEQYVTATGAGSSGPPWPRRSNDGERSAGVALLPSAQQSVLRSSWAPTHATSSSRASRAWRRAPSSPSTTRTRDRWSTRRPTGKRSGAVRTRGVSSARSTGRW